MFLDERKYPSTESLLLFHEDCNGNNNDKWVGQRVPVSQKTRKKIQHL